jgi:hypothetical protein
MPLASVVPTLSSAFMGAVFGELVGNVLRSTGRLRSTPTGDPGVAVAGILETLIGQNGTTHMSGYDIVGDDYGFIGWDQLIGAMGDDDFLDSLVEGGAADFLVSGDGSSEIIGAAAASKQKLAAAKKAAALKQLAMRNAGAVVNRGLDRRRRYPLGFVPTAVAAATTVQIPSAPQNLYRPERLVIPSDIAFDAGVADIKVGNQSQLVQSVEVPAALFSEVAINTGVTFDTAEVGNQVSVNIRNKSASAFEFTAGLVGTIAK